jgi:hypothetical protein
VSLRKIDPERDIGISFENRGRGELFGTACFMKPQEYTLNAICMEDSEVMAMGLALITQPTVLMEWSGFKPEYERFFPTQGGVFHLLMAVAYVMGAMNSKKYYYLIIFSIIVKAVATIFLIVYCFIIEFKWTIFIFGIGDGVMGLMIFIALEYYINFQTSCGNE